MATTPLWVPLAVAALAVLGTLAGVVFTQAWNSRLEERRWSRESERLREAQAREDTNRTYEHRRSAYIDFLQELERLHSLYIPDEPQESEPPARHDPAYRGLYERFDVVRIYDTPEATLKAVLCVDDLERAAADPGNYELTQAWRARVDYLNQVRKDLGIPGGAFAGRGSDQRD